MEKEKTNTKTKAKTKRKTTTVRSTRTKSTSSSMFSLLDNAIEKASGAGEIFYAFVDTLSHRIASRIALRLMAYALVSFGILFVFVGLADILGMLLGVPGLGKMIIGGISLVSALILFLVLP